MQEAAAAGFPPQYWAETVDVQDPKHRLMPIPQDGGDDEPLAERLAASRAQRPVT